MALLATAIAVSSTAYCLGGTMADSTAVRAGSIAHNGYPLGTRLTVEPSPTGRQRWTVRDRIGWGTELDFWLPTCGAARAWGRRRVTIRRGWPQLRITFRQHATADPQLDPRRGAAPRSAPLPVHPLSAWPACAVPAALQALCRAVSVRVPRALPHP